MKFNTQKPATSHKYYSQEALNTVQTLLNVALNHYYNWQETKKKPVLADMARSDWHSFRTALHCTRMARICLADLK